ncbi:peptidase inhibitor family I36 protein [Streptomyces sp. CA-243310]|uniref:peptidase inhibitor family I36 protein n=1 Tax=Streptomyces sp. CA-243310 TaxID=3240056 RepID=UPI003D8A1978
MDFERSLMRSRVLSSATAAVSRPRWCGALGQPGERGGFGLRPVQVCLYKDYDYNGSMLVVAHLGLPHHDLKDDRFNDMTSSVINNSAGSVRLYQDSWYSGKYIQVNPGERIANLSRVHIYNADGSYFGVKHLQRQGVLDRLSTHHVTAR